MHPIAWELHRVAGRDDTIPLAFPVTTRAGEKLTSITVAKGQKIALSLCAYNRYVRAADPSLRAIAR